MINCKLAVWTHWPETPTKTQKTGQFKVDYSTLLNELNYELDYLDAKEIVVQIAVPESKLNKVRNSNTGWPKADTRTINEGVILNFASRKGALQFACDTYMDVAGRNLGWQDNLRAISLTLTALRAINRYGATKQEQQYRGFTALPPPSAPVIETKVTPVSAALCLAMYSSFVKDYILESPETFQKAYREAAKQAHPDMGGNNERMAAC